MSTKIYFAHISPESYMETAHKHSEINLVLAHLIGDNAYTDFYSKSSKLTIMDNGAFELGASYDPEKLIDLGRKVKADYLVLPDYPNVRYKATIEAAEKWIPEFKKAGFNTFFVPQSLYGDENGYFQAWEWAANNPDIDLIGCSILGAPIGLGVNSKFRRTIARYEVLCKLSSSKFADKLRKRIHMLGMLDTVREIALCNVFKDLIFSWDSSAAVWYGMKGLDVSETFEKLSEPVDFKETSLYGYLVEKNIKYVNKLLEV